MPESDIVSFLINGKQYQIRNGELPHDYTLIQFIREKALLTGTKLSCGEGGCAICTVTVSINDLDPGRPVISCLVPVYMCHGWKITTVEGLGSEKTGYHPIQKTLADNNGSQCGFCSPGMVMTMYGALQQDRSLSKEQIEHTFAGNMCRCTGYRAIVDSMQKVLDIEDVAVCSKKGGCTGCKCNKVTQNVPTGADEAIAANNKPVAPIQQLRNYVAHLFGDESVLHSAIDVCLRRKSLVSVPASFSEDGVTWYRPTSLQQLRDLIKQSKGTEIKLVAGHTGFGLDKTGLQAKIFISLIDITDFGKVTRVSSTVEIGCGVSLTILISLFEELSSQSTSYTYLKEAVQYLNVIANLQIRNLGTWAGNLMVKYNNGEFSSDIFILLESIGALLNIYDCYTGTVQRMSVLSFLAIDMTGKYIESMVLAEKPNYSLVTFKIMPRYRNALTMLSLAFGVEVDSSYSVKGKPQVLYAGISKDFVHATEVEDYLEGKDLNDNKTLQGCWSLIDKIVFEDSLTLPNPAYRKQLAKSLLQKATLRLTAGEDKSKILGGQTITRSGVSGGTLTFETFPSEYPMTQPTPKLDSVKQTAGEAQYTGDLPAMAGQLEAVFVTATIGSGEISSIDTSEAEKMPGVVSVLTAKDIPGKNVLFSFATGDEQLLIDKTVSYYGQPLAIVVAETQSQALAARVKVKVEYINLKKPLLTISDAKAAQSFFPIPDPSVNDVISGDAKGAMTKCDTVVKGTIEVGEQYPMHLEPQNALVSIQEGYIVAYTATQILIEIRNSISRLLNVSSNMIDARTRRVGGGFGAKQARSVYPAGGAAVAAFCTQRPVKMYMTLEDNMAIFGRRNPISIDYEIGATKDLKIQSLIATTYENCGFLVGDNMAAFYPKWLDGAYFMANWDVRVKQCKTNQPTHSYIRSPGAANSAHFVEQILDHLAFVMKVSGEQLREANLYKEGQITPYKMPLINCHIEELYSQLKTSCKYDDRLKEIEEFNKTSQWRKKALALMPLKYGMIYFAGTDFLVHVMINDNDGSVTIIHGGIELGQGINTKTIQVAAKAFGLPMDMIKVQPTSTVFSLQSAVTGGSITSDMNCVAVQQACDQLVEKLKPYREKTSDWLSAIKLARQTYADLHAKQHISCDDMTGDTKTFWKYNIYGTTCAEVELDCLTGQYIVQRIDMLYDAGKSYSPEIDSGQIHGAFVMGMGLFLYEEIKYDPNTGKNIADSTWNYHVPMVGDIPFEFNVDMVKNLPNMDFSLRSKIVGEPPLLMAECVVLALKKAINEYRKAHDISGFVSVDSPFSIEKIFMACQGL